MTQGIETKYFGPSNTKGSRIKASAWAGSVTIGYDYALDAEDNHANAAMALAKKLGWGGDYVQGGNAKGNGYLFVKRERYA